MSRYGKLMGSTPAQPEPQDEVVAERSTPTPVKSEVAKSVRTNAPTIAPTHQKFHDDEVVAAIHKAMRQPPANGTNYRLSAMEKKRLDVVVFELKTREIATADGVDIKTNINEVLRIAVNNLLIDYSDKGNDSVLVKTLLSLRS